MVGGQVGCHGPLVQYHVEVEYRHALTRVITLLLSMVEETALETSIPHEPVPQYLVQVRIVHYVSKFS